MYDRKVFECLFWNYVEQRYSVFLKRPCAINERYDIDLGEVPARAFYVVLYRRDDAEALASLAEKGAISAKDYKEHLAIATGAKRPKCSAFLLEWGHKNLPQGELTSDLEWKEEEE